ncbi:hypothetical protein Mapa_012774 [Marchantia paleacea]|nr:hypothetical protein Mapa_012774 [Marchantia paleacea]
MDPEFADMLKAQCPQTKPFDFMAYYLDLLTNKGLLESDVALLSDPLGIEYAIKVVQDVPLPNQSTDHEEPTN